MLPMCRTLLASLVAIGAAGAAGLAAAQSPEPAPQAVTIHAGALIDGRGHVARNVTVTVVGSRIAAVAPGRIGTPTYDFSRLTVMPGMIDTHVHITEHFNDEGRATAKGETGEQRALKWAENLQATLHGGFTTVQSLGSDDDLLLRTAIEGGRLAGPRLLTSAKAFNDPRMTPDEIRAFVAATKAKGADVVKIFASASSRDGGAPTLSDAQIAAACGEARRIGIRTWVHAHAAAAVRQAVDAGCYAITHARFTTPAALDLAAKRGVFIEPSWGVVQQNYIAHQPKYEGIGNYTAEAFERMRAYLPTTPPVWRMMLGTRGLKLLSGSDAVAGAEGHNVEEIIWRIEQGQAAMEALTIATSANAAALGVGDVTGAVVPGLEADIIALDGDPLTDTSALRRVVFVMKGGRIFKNVAPRR